MNRQPCQGGFCHLHLPTSANIIPPCNSKQKLSKREKRLLKSIQRDRATKLLQWTLREEEFSRLDENGDLVRLRVRDCSTDGVGCWVKNEAVRLARLEHRPELAQLAFSEFACQMDEDCAPLSPSNDSSPVLIEPPSQEDGLHDNVLVCGVCSTVYHLLEQARELLNSIETQQHHVEIAESGNDECNNNDGSHQAEDQTATINRVDDIPNNSLKKSKTEGPNSEQWASAKQQSLQSRSPSFHGPVNSWSDAPSAATLVGKKRDRKKMEENSIVHILIAESDHVSVIKRNGIYV